MKKATLCMLLALGLGGALARPAAAQDSNDTKVYTYVEQMPQLPGGGGQQALVAAVQQRLVLPPNAPEGRIFVKFTVGLKGEVRSAEIIKSLDAATDAAVLEALQKLPPLEPGKQNGRVVQVSFTLPITIFSPTHVFEAREVGTRAQFPAPGLYAYLKRNLRVPPVVATEKLHGQIGVDFVVLPSGKTDQATLTSHLCASCDAEALRLVRSFPAWTPAQQAGKAVTMRQHLDIPMPLPDAQAPYTRPAQLPDATYLTVPPTLFDGTTAQALGPVLTQTMRYPEAARREKITGTVQLNFVVDATGIVRDATITQSVCSSCDQAVLDALAALGPLLPGKQDSQAVATQVRVAVPFNPALAAAAK